MLLRRLRGCMWQLHCMHRTTPHGTTTFHSTTEGALETSSSPSRNHRDARDTKTNHANPCATTWWCRRPALVGNGQAPQLPVINQSVKISPVECKVAGQVRCVITLKFSLAHLKFLKIKTLNTWYCVLCTEVQHSCLYTMKKDAQLQEPCRKLVAGGAHQLGVGGYDVIQRGCIISPTSKDASSIVCTTGGHNFISRPSEGALGMHTEKYDTSTSWRCTSSQADDDGSSRSYDLATSHKLHRRSELIFRGGDLQNFYHFIHAPFLVLLLLYPPSSPVNYSILVVEVVLGNYGWKN